VGVEGVEGGGEYREVSLGIIEKQAVNVRMFGQPNMTL